MTTAAGLPDGHPSDHARLDPDRTAPVTLPPRKSWPPPARTTPPRPVVVAMWLIVAGAALELVDGAHSVVAFLTGSAVDTGAAISAIAWTVLAGAVLMTLAGGVRIGSNMARLALTVVGVGWVLTSPAHASAWMISIIVTTLEVVLIVPTLVLVYLPASSRWFAAHPVPNPAVGAPVTLDPAVRRARSLGWRMLGAVVGGGVPLTLVWAFIVAWGVSDGCGSTSSGSGCYTTSVLLEIGAPAVATLVATIVTATGLVLARSRPALAQRVVVAGVCAWLVIGSGMWALAQLV